MAADLVEPYFPSRGLIAMEEKKGAEPVYGLALFPAFMWSDTCHDGDGRKMRDPAGSPVFFHPRHVSVPNIRASGRRPS